MNTTKKWLNSKNKTFFVILFAFGIVACIAHKASDYPARGELAVESTPPGAVAQGPSRLYQRDAGFPPSPTVPRSSKNEDINNVDIGLRKDTFKQAQTSPNASRTTENLILIPAGTFTMGSDRRAADEKPVHKVYLDAYYIGTYEVTNAEYYEFWAASHYPARGELAVETPEHTPPKHTPEDFAHLPQIGTWPGRAKKFPNHPVVGVSWHDAQAYAEWKGMRLPTEAEWEKAARGYTDRTWPWGNAMEPYANTSAAEDGYENQLAPVGSFPKGKSYYGALDMAGNVWEWTADWYSDVYYFRSAKRNPPGPDVGSWRVIRGGSWIDALPRCSTTFRFYLYPRLKTSFVGFRLAKTPLSVNRMRSHR